MQIHGLDNWCFSSSSALLKKLELSPVAPLLILLLGGVSWYRSLVAFDRRQPAGIGCSGVLSLYSGLSQHLTNPVSKFPMTKKGPWQSVRILWHHMNHVLGTAPKDLIQTFLTDLTNARENQLSPTGREERVASFCSSEVFITVKGFYPQKVTSFVFLQLWKREP